MIYFDVLAHTGDSTRFVISDSTEQGYRVLRADGTWSDWHAEGSDFTEVTLTIPGHVRGLSRREVLAGVAAAFSRMAPETTNAAEVKVLREWLAVEQRRVDKALV